MLSGQDQKFISSELSRALTTSASNLIDELVELARLNNIPFSTVSDEKESSDSPLEMSEIIKAASDITSSHNLQACNSSLKRAILPSVQLAYCLYLDKRYSSNISKIRIYEFDGFNPKAIMQMMKADLNYYIVISMTNGQKIRFIIKDKKALPKPNLITNILDCIPEHCLEVVLPKSVRKSSTPLAASTWTTMYSTPSEVTMYYSKINDPIMLKAIQSCDFTQENMPVILDIGAGCGRLAEKILTWLSSNNIVCHYVLIEPTQSELLLAQKKFADSPHQITYVNGLACESTLRDYKGLANLIITSGGPLNDQIVDLDTAHSVANLLFGCLKHEGKLISTGLTYNLLNAKTFKALGFNVHQMVSRNTHENISMSEQDATSEQQNEWLQCYVLSKPPLTSFQNLCERDELPAVRMCQGK